MLKTTGTDLINYVKNLKKSNAMHLNVFSAILKRERLQQNLTLEEVSSGICSVSYLSKLENNQIEPKDDYLKFLFDRLSIDYNQARDNDYERILLEMIKAYFLENYDKIHDLVKKIDFSMFDCNASLCKVVYDFTISDFDDAKKLLNEVDDVKNCLSVESGEVFVYLLSEYSVLTNDYSSSLEYLASTNNYYFKDRIIRDLILENYCITTYHITKNYKFIKLYESLAPDFKIAYPSNRSSKINILYKTLLGLDDGSSYNDLISVIDSINDPLADFENYYYALVGLCRIGYFTDVISIIEASGMYYKKEILCVYGFAICTLRLKNKYLHFLDLIENLKIDKIRDQHDLFIMFLREIFLRKSPIDIADYIRHVVRPFIDTFPHALYDKCYYYEYYEALTSLSKYKDLSIFLKEKIRYI